MELTVLIIFIGASVLFVINFKDYILYKTLAFPPKDEVNRTNTTLIILFVVIAISAGMVWG